MSVASDGTQGNSVSKGFQAISADGRYISFQSSASNITPGDTNANEDIFVHDRVTGVTGLVSVASDGSQGNRSSTHSSISADGRFVSFQSFSTNFVPGDTNQLDDVFVHDRETGTTERISVALDGSERSHGSVWPSISADGQFVTFFVQFSDRSDVFVHDRVTGVTGLVSVASDGSQGNNFSWFPAISGNGRFVVFRSEATNLVSGDTNGYPDVFVHDRQTHSTKRVSVASDGTQGNSGSEQPSISADGLFVLFVSAATNLVPGDTNGFSDVFVTQNSFLLPNSAPTANATGPYTVVEGGTVTLNGSGSDLDNDPLTYTWDLDNDGSFETPGQNPVFSAVGKDGQSTHSITLQVCDDEIACGTSTPIEVQITNAAPTPDPITASVNPLQVNTATTTSSSFTDPAGTLDAPYTVEWNWGDGNIDIETVGAPGTVVKEYTYTQAGVFEITLTITDKDGGVGTQPFQYLSVYSPTAQGLFSAGQKFTSPAGTYLQDPNATGNVMFGLSYKYQGELPAGNRQFTMDFKTANFEFNATTVSSLVIANGVGTLRGTGTITDLSGEYDFLVVGNEVTGSIRIQIKDSAGTIIYDTQPGASDTADPTTPVTGNMLAH